MDIKVYDMDLVGVVVDTNPIGEDPASLTKAQNAIPDPIGEAGSIRKRPGLKPLNATAGNGSVQGGIGVPITLGSAGPLVNNPFSDSTITLVPTVNFQYTEALGPTFDDEAFWFEWDWYFDFEEVEIPDVLFDAADAFDLSDDIVPALTDTENAAQSIPAAPTLVPYNFAGTFLSTGWYLSLEKNLTQHVTYPSSFVGESPSQPRMIYPSGGFSDYSTFTINSLNGGLTIQMTSPRPAVLQDGTVYYASSTGSSQNVLRGWNGTTDRQIFQVTNGTGTYGTLINAVCAANGRVYFTAWMSGTTASSTGVGAVFEHNPSTNGTRQLGATFAVDQIPFSMCFAYGKLFVGTVSNASSCKVYWMRPDIDTAFTLDTTFAAGESAVTDLAVFQGQIYAALLNRTLAGSGRVAVRTTLGVWSSSDTGTIDGNGAHGSTRGYYSLMTWPPEDSGLSTTSCLFATRLGMTEDSATGATALRKLSSGTWSTVQNPSGLLLVPLMAVSSSQIVPVLIAAGGAVYYYSTDGTTFTTAAANLTITAKGFFPTMLMQVPGSNGVAV
jgi:hypothetical protein